MALDDVIKGFEKFEKMAGIAQAVASPEGQNDPNTFQSYLEFLKKFEGYSDERIEGMANDRELRRSPMDRIELARDYLHQSQRNLLEKVEGEYPAIMEELGNERLLKLALTLDSKDKPYRNIQREIESGNLDKARQAYAGLAPKDEIWQKYVGRMSDESLKNYLAYYVAENQRIFVEKKLSDKTKDDKGKTKYAINNDKVKSYVLSLIDTYKAEKEKGEPQLNNAYVAIAREIYEAKKSKK